jgi:hypothetical protein
MRCFHLRQWKGQSIESTLPGLVFTTATGIRKDDNRTSSTGWEFSSGVSHSLVRMSPGVKELPPERPTSSTPPSFEVALVEQVKKKKGPLSRPLPPVTSSSSNNH